MLALDIQGLRRGGDTLINTDKLRKVHQSSEWNLQRREHIRAILLGEEPNIPCVDGWYRVSRHAAGIDSAYVIQTKLRRTYPALETYVKNTVKDDKVKWNAEIWVRHKQKDD